MNDKIRIMRDENISTALLKFGIPAIIGFLVTAVYNFVDALFVSKLGTNAIGATSVVFPISLVMIGVGLLLGSGAAAHISIALGRNKINEASKSASTALWGIILLGSVVIVSIITFFVPIMQLFGATKTIMPYAKDYGYTFVWASIFSIINIVLNHIARAEGAAKLSMRALMLGAFLNIVLDPIFIYLLDYGVFGAAVATLISQLISTIWLLSYFKSKKSIVTISLKNVSFANNIFTEMLKVGTPYSIAQLLAGLSMGLINSAAAPYGDAAVAAVGIANRIFAVGIYAMIGFSKGYQPIAGYNYGAKNYPRLDQATSLAIKWTTYGGIILALLQIIFAKSIISIFTNDSDVIAVGIKTLISYSAVLPLFGYQVIYLTLFLALEKAGSGFVLSTGRQGIFLIPTILFIPNILGLDGVIYSQPIADILTVILTFIYSLKMKKMRRKFS